MLMIRLINGLSSSFSFTTYSLVAEFLNIKKKLSWLRVADSFFWISGLSSIYRIIKQNIHFFAWTASDKQSIKVKPELSQKFLSFKSKTNSLFEDVFFLYWYEEMICDLLSTVALKPIRKLLLRRRLDNALFTFFRSLRRSFIEHLVLDEALGVTWNFRGNDESELFWRLPTKVFSFLDGFDCTRVWQKFKRRWRMYL